VGHRSAWTRAAVAALVILAAGEPRNAAAHAVPVEATPPAGVAVSAPPPEVRLRFSERVDPNASVLTVLDGRGRRVDRDDAHVAPDDPWTYRVGVEALPSGAYTVAWRVMSADDGHVTEGTQVFLVGDGVSTGPGSTARLTAPSSALARTGRWLALLGEAVTLGLLLGPLLLGGAIAVPASPGRLAPWVLLATVGVLMCLLGQARLAAPGELFTEGLVRLASTAPGRVAFLKLVVPGLVLAAVAGHRRRARAPGRVPWLAAGLAGLDLAAGAWTSHAAAAIEARGVALTAATLHLVAIGVWVGGLAAFVAAVWSRPIRGDGDSARPPVARVSEAIAAFSVPAALSVGGVVLAGAYLARLHLASLATLLGTGYGRLLIVKLGVVVTMLALGAAHQQIVHPRLLRALHDGAGGGRTVRRFRWTLGGEAALGTVALGLAAWLGSTPPPASSIPSAPAPPPIRHSAMADGIAVELEIAPGWTGPNTIALRLAHAHGHPLEDARAVLLQLRPPGGEAGPLTVTLASTGPGVFRAEGAAIGLEGTWRARLVVQRAGAYDLRDAFDVVVAPSVGSRSAATRPPLDRPMGAIALATLLCTGAVVGLACRARRRTEAALLFTHDAPVREPARR
jgi:copper transport protein